MSCFNDWTERFDGGGGVKSYFGDFFLQSIDKKCRCLVIFFVRPCDWPIKNNFAVHDDGGKF